MINAIYYAREATLVRAANKIVITGVVRVDYGRGPVDSVISTIEIEIGTDTVFREVGFSIDAGGGYSLAMNQVIETSECIVYCHKIGGLFDV